MHPHSLSFLSLSSMLCYGDGNVFNTLLARENRHFMFQGAYRKIWYNFMSGFKTKFFTCKIAFSDIHMYNYHPWYCKELRKWLHTRYIFKRQDTNIKLKKSTCITKECSVIEGCANRCVVYISLSGNKLPWRQISYTNRRFWTASITANKMSPIKDFSETVLFKLLFWPSPTWVTISVKECLTAETKSTGNLMCFLIRLTCIIFFLKSYISVPILYWRLKFTKIYIYFSMFFTMPQNIHYRICDRCLLNCFGKMNSTVTEYRKCLYCCLLLSDRVKSFLPWKDINLQFPLCVYSKWTIKKKKLCKLFCDRNFSQNY